MWTFCRGAVNIVNSSGGGEKRGQLQDIVFPERLYWALNLLRRHHWCDKYLPVCLWVMLSAVCMLIYLFSACLDIVWVKKCARSLPCRGICMLSSYCRPTYLPSGVYKIMLPLSGWFIKQHLEWEHFYYRAQTSYKDKACLHSPINYTNRCEI